MRELRIAFPWANCFHFSGSLAFLSYWPMWTLTQLFFLFFSSQNNLNLLLTEEEMYSLTETFQQCKVIPGKAGGCCWAERGWFLHHPFQEERNAVAFGGSRVNKSLFPHLTTA